MKTFTIKLQKNMFTYKEFITLYLQNRYIS